MRVAVVANCQYGGISKCLALATGLPEIEGLNGERLESSDETLIEPLERADFVFVQTGKCATLLAENLPKVAERAVRFPRITFNAFHPDLCVVRGAGSLVQTPLGNNNSRLSVSAYRHGLSVEETVELFRGSVFEAVGYFDRWSGARETLQQQFAESDIETDHLFRSWVASGCFMHSSLHPKLHVLADVACAMARKLGVKTRTSRPDAYLHDVLKDAPIWPVYPEIGAVHGIEGDYCFRGERLRGGHRFLSLPEFVAESFKAYSSVESVDVPGFDTTSFIKKALSASSSAVAGSSATRATAATGVATARSHPYAHISEHQRWRSAVAETPPAEIDPVVAPRFTLSPQDRVATTGSCFAQHIAQRLDAAGLNYFVTEPAPAGMSAEEAGARHYGVFSARYDNVYSARQLDQLFARALGSEVFDEPAWPRDDGRVADPFRPAIEPAGFESEAALDESRARHLAAVRDMMEGLDVLVFTLGLTEAWRSKRTGTVFPSAPGVIAGVWDEREFEFVNFSVDEVVADVSAAFDKVLSVNPRARFILTVSPVPLAATYEPRHVLQSTTYSKAVLRVAADRVCRDRANALYFPSYEIVASSFSRGAYFEPDLRGVTPAGVDHVMRLFLHHLYGRAPVEIPDYEIFCEEDAIA